jgi:predicted metalloprotease
MRWLGDRESENVEDRRSMGGGFPVGITGGVGAIVVLIIGLFLGIDPSTLMAVLNGNAPDTPADSRQVDQPGYGSSRPPDTRAGGEDRMRQFVSVVLADTEDVWRQTFSDMGRRYSDPKLVLYSDRVPSPCGMASSASGPFYCPNDHKVYLDTAFFEDMKNRFHASGEFAQAYVIAHEIGHHVQNELGILQKANDARARADQRTSNAISVRVELQADCFAGVWANHADRAKHILEQGDVEAAMNAASSVGDDRLQRQTRGTVVPDAFTHGSSAQRVAWFKRGIESGNLKSCDTFAAAQP